MFDNCTASDFNLAWRRCALNSQSVDNILVSLDASGVLNGVVHIDNEGGIGTNSAPGPAGLASKASLEAKGWNVQTVPAASWFQSIEDWRYNIDSAGIWPLI
jgi:hypothetical protein